MNEILSFVNKNKHIYILGFLFYTVLNVWSSYPWWYFLIGLVIVIMLLSGILLILSDEQEKDDFDDWMCV